MVTEPPVATLSFRSLTSSKTFLRLLVSREEIPEVVGFRNLQGLVARTPRKGWKLMSNIKPLRPPPGGIVGEVGVYPI
jgi:hypothetical protein